MSDLISIGLSATRAVSASLRMVGENIANADDPAYVRRRVILAEAALPTRGSPLYRAQISTGGVSITGVGRSVDPFVDAQLRRAEGSRVEAAQRAEWLGRVETALGDGEFGIGARMTAFFAAATRATANPDDPTLRGAMLNGLDRVAAGFISASQRLAAVDADMSTAVGDAAGSLNARLDTLAGIGRDLRAARPGSAAQAQLFDRRDQAIQDIHMMVPVAISFDPHGAATLSANGAILVDGITSQSVIGARTPEGGVALSVGGTPLSQLPGGQIAGLNQAGLALAQRMAALDSLAAGFVSDLNSWNAGGATATGPGAALMSGSTAATIALVTNDIGAIAAATPGGNPAGNLLSLDSLRGSAGGEQRWDQLINDAANASSNARVDATAAELFADQARTQRDAVSGVDLDVEAAEMVRLQQAYGAAARVLQVARDTVQTILDIV